MGYSDFQFKTPLASAYEEVTLGTAEASKAVVLDANKKIDGIVLTDAKIDDTDAGVIITSADQTHANPTVTIPNIVDAADTFVVLDTAQTLTNKTLTSPKINEDVVLTSTATELNVLDAVARGSLVVGGAAGTTVLNAKTSGQILVGDGADLVSVPVSGDASLGADGTLALAVPKLSYINKICTIANFTDNLDTTGYIDFTSQLPAGAIVVGWKAIVSAGFAGDTSAVIQIGVAGTLGKFSASVAQSVFAAGTVGSGAPMDTCFNAVASTPRITVTGNADFTSIVTEGNGAMNVYLYYIATV